MILNARDAMFNGGTITLKTAVDESGVVVVEVSDTGEGIPAENLKKVFDPFLPQKKWVPAPVLALPFHMELSRNIPER